MAEDSSSEEDFSKFEESVDIKLTQAFSNNTASMKNQTSIDNKSTAASLLLPSLRKSEKEDNMFLGDHRSVQVTPEFQKFVAKKLEDTLERYLTESSSVTYSNEQFNAKSKKKMKIFSEDSGIKLFKTSADPIRSFIEDSCVYDNIIQENNKNIMKRKNNHYNEKKELEKIKAVVVDSDFILNGKELKTWSKDVRGEVIKVKTTSEKNVFSIEPECYIPPEAWTGRIMR